MRSLGITASYTRAIQFVGQSSGNAGSLTLPSGLEPNDLIIFMVHNNNNGVVESGWNLGGNGTTGALTYYWYWKYFVSGDTTITMADGSDPLSCAVFRNVDPVYPFDATPTTANGGGANTGQPNPPSITTVNPSSIVVALGWLDDDNTTLGAPNNYRLINTVNGGLGVGAIGMAYREVVTAGAADPAAFQNGSDDWAAVSIALRSNAYFANLSATGGTEYTSGEYKYHKFTANGNFVVASVGSVALVEVLCVAGGGGGGEGTDGGGGGGGGAGGLELKTGITPTATTYAIVVGGGGAGSTTSGTTGSNGNASSFASTTVATVGGGAGGGGNNSGGAGGATRSGQTGGSGGGGGAGSFAGGFAGGVSVSGEGFAGGAGASGDGGGGGGGAGGVGEAGATDGANNGGDGGLGADYSVWATATSSGNNGFFASGGGGGGDSVGGAASDGGGANGTTGATNATNATANTGGGGGGSETGNASNGGSGIVIVRYKVA